MQAWAVQGVGKPYQSSRAAQATLEGCPLAAILPKPWLHLCSRRKRDNDRLLGVSVRYIQQGSADNPLLIFYYSPLSSERPSAASIARHRWLPSSCQMYDAPFQGVIRYMWRLQEALSGRRTGALIVLIFSPHRTSFADEKSPSGPEMAVSVCPHRGPGGLPRHGNGLGLGAGSG